MRMVVRRAAIRRSCVHRICGSTARMRYVTRGSLSSASVKYDEYYYSVSLDEDGHEDHKSWSNSARAYAYGTESLGRDAARY